MSVKKILQGHISLANLTLFPDFVGKGLAVITGEELVDAYPRLSEKELREKKLMKRQKSVDESVHSGEAEIRNLPLESLYRSYTLNLNKTLLGSMTPSGELSS
jgi:hypothetical protein